MLEVAAEPTRRRLLQLLATGEHTVTQLAAQFPVTRSAISQHLAVLAEVGLVTARKQGRERYYRLDQAGVLRLRALVETFWSDELDRLIADSTTNPGDPAMPFDKTVVVPLDPAATFALITQPDRLRRWMTVAARVDLRAGGQYRWTVSPGHSAAGTVTEVEPGKRVVFTWGWEADGDPAPGGSTVTVTLTPVADGTEVRLVHDGLTEEQAARHAEGWNHYLERLVAAGQHGDAGPDEWAAEPPDLNETTCAETTLAVLQHTLRPMGPADLQARTPCAEYDVAALAEHLLNSITVLGAAAGAVFPQRDTGAPLEVQVADAAQPALEAWRRRGVDGVVEAAGRPTPANVAVDILSLEFLVHAWDFAAATDRKVVVSEPVAEYVLAAAGRIITPEARGFAGFADPVDVPPGGGALDRLIAFTGRQPATRSAATD